MGQTKKKQSQNKKGGVSVGSPKIAAQRVEPAAQPADPAQDKAAVTPAAPAQPVAAPAAAPAASARKKLTPVRLALMIAAIVLACFIVVMIVLLVLPPRHPGENEYYLPDLREEQVDSIAAYNEEHNTRYCYPSFNLSGLYSTQDAAAYYDGRVAVLLYEQFTYDETSCELYIQTDEEDTFNIFHSLPTMTSDFGIYNEDAGLDIEVYSAETNGVWYARAAHDGCLYRFRIDAETEGQYRNIVMAVLFCYVD